MRTGLSDDGLKGSASDNNSPGFARSELHREGAARTRTWHRFVQPAQAALAFSLLRNLKSVIDFNAKISIVLSILL
jgi:hypothetical protein